MTCDGGGGTMAMMRCMMQKRRFVNGNGGRVVSGRGKGTNVWYEANENRGVDGNGSGMMRGTMHDDDDDKSMCKNNDDESPT